MISKNESKFVIDNINMSSGATSPPSEKSSPTAAAAAAATTPVVALAANNGNIKQPASENSINNMVEISIDTSSQFVNIRQQDSGSNQSGSDSGLGYTNSISIDNSSFIVATSQDQAESKHQSIVINSSKSGNTSSSNNTLSMNNSPSSSSITKQANKGIELGNTIEETRTSSIELKKQSSELGFKSDHAPQLRFTNDDHDGDDVLGRHHNVTHRNDELVSAVQPYAPIIKSLLKKSSQFNDANHKPTKHNRNVSFNQTVIVFCEETEMPSSVDQFDPPVGYQDSIRSFEPPDDYCDHKNERVDENSNDVTDKGSKIAAAAKVNRVLNNTNKKSASDLNDDQLFGLLDNGSLLESFKLNREDFSEDDFPINYLNSSHSYLCNDAISDYDSDSESSLYIEREKQNSILPSVTKSAQLIGNYSHVDIKLKSKGIEKSKSPSDGDKNAQLNNNRNYPKDELPSTRSTKVAVNQKSMPARMKVSTVDSSHLKRNSNLNRKEDADQKSKLDSSQSVVGNNSKQLQLERKQPGESLDTPNLAPMVIKQSTVEPISLSKPIIVRNNFSNFEQLTNVDRAPDRESKFVTSGTQSLTASKQPGKMKECNTSSETIINQPQKIQQISQANVNMMPPTSQSNEPTCQICRVIESNRSQTNPEHKAINSQDAQPVKSFSHNSVERETCESQPNQIQFIKAPDDQPVVFNQSCVSCREALMKQQQPAQENTCARTTTQPVRAVAYQLVYVVDQKGNRVRALSVRPAFNAPVTSVQQASLAGRRILIAQNGQRFQYPISINDQATNNLQKDLVNPTPQWGQNPMSNNNTQQYRLIDSAQAQITQQAQHNKELRGQQVSCIRGILPVQKVPLESSGLRQHTVYYVRQPLDNQNIRQSCDATRSNYRSFPDPHEIRRLDGLKGPTATMSLSHWSDHNTGPKVSNDARSETNASRNEFPREDVDDPTFGFSNRPSVKVVATSSSHTSSSNPNSQSYATSNMKILDSNQEHHLNSSNVNTLKRYVANQPVNVRPVSLVVMGSQTLDRRLASSQQVRGIKENIPTTNSMSNIHGTLTGIPPNKVSNMNLNQQQQGISNVQIIDPNIDKLTPKGTSYSSFKRWLSSKLT